MLSPVCAFDASDRLLRYQETRGVDTKSCEREPSINNPYHISDPFDCPTNLVGGSNERQQEK
jgi:hypothetical protein